MTNPTGGTTGRSPGPRPPRRPARHESEAELRTALVHNALLEERMRLVVDAHDVLLQQLYAAGLLLDLMPRTAGVPAELDETLGAVRHSIAELRSTVRGLAQGRTTSLSAVVEVLTAQLHAWLGPCPTIELHLHGPDQVPESVAQDVLEALARTVHVTARRPGAAGSTLTVALDPAQDRVLLTLVGPDGRPVEEWTAEVSAHPHLRPSAK